MKVPGDLENRVHLLERARKDTRLTSFLSPEAASAFGAFPVDTEDETLVVAVPSWADPRLYALLGKALGRPVRPVPMEGDLVLGFIARVYLVDAFPNFHTFPDPDFVKEENLPLLVCGKEEPLPAPSIEIPADAVLLLDLVLVSELRNLDRYEGEVKFHSGDLEIPFSRRGGEVRVYGGALEPAVRILLKLSYVYEGMEHRHGFKAHRLEALPHALHPTELQIVSVAENGETGFWVFDGVRSVTPGSVASLACTYHFLNFGNRYRRILTLHVLGATVVPRDGLVIEDGESLWTLDDFDRWFGAAPA